MQATTATARTAALNARAAKPAATPTAAPAVIGAVIASTAPAPAAPPVTPAPVATVTPAPAPLIIAPAGSVAGSVANVVTLPAPPPTAKGNGGSVRYGQQHAAFFTSLLQGTHPAVAGKLSLATVKKAYGISRHTQRAMLAAVTAGQVYGAASGAAGVQYVVAPAPTGNA